MSKCCFYGISSQICLTICLLSHIFARRSHTDSEMCRWEKDEEERKIKEDGKREKTALATWRKWLTGLRIIQRVKEEYGGDAPDAYIAEEMNPFTNSSKAKKALQADSGKGSSPNGGLFPHADNEEDIGGGFLADDNDLDGGGFFPEGHDGLDIEDGSGPVNSGASNDSPTMKPSLVTLQPPGTDNSEEGLIEADLDGSAAAPEKVSTNGKKRKAAASLDGKIFSNPPRRRAAPKRNAARKSETALKSHYFEHQSDEDVSSNRGSVTSMDVAVKKSAKRKRNKDGASTLRAKKSN